LPAPAAASSYLVLDGAGGLRDGANGKTALEMARTPNLDRVMRDSACGLLELVGPGITPGSGPGQLTLFGYDPLRFRLGRGVLSALGVDFDLREGAMWRRASTSPPSTARAVLPTVAPAAFPAKPIAVCATGFGVPSSWISTASGFWRPSPSTAPYWC
jgi:hypothetical protein